VGCGEPAAQVATVSRSYQNLKALGIAYASATASLGMPPKDANELLPFVKHKGQGEPRAILQTSDGEEYTILWGSAPHDEHTSFVIAYEPHEKAGKRFVLIGRDVFQMTDEQFKKASFPPGHRAPQE